jgi:hypothetical protein
LELAAKAAGIEVWWTENYGGVLLQCRSSPVIWNPLNEDGDALRLAVMLELLVGIHGDEVWAQKYMGEDAGWLTIKEPPGLCRFSTTRRAIVRAAAEIGAAQRAQAQKGQA